jgi:anti-sigma factor RsiW
MIEVACRSGVDQLMDYLEGVLPPAVVSAIDSHVLGCERCQAFLASYRATPRIMRDATEVVPPPSLPSSLIAWLRERRG